MSRNIYTLLHFSDIHFLMKNEKVIKMALDNLRKPLEGKKIHAALFSGDLLWHDKDNTDCKFDLFRPLITLLDDLKNSLGLKNTDFLFTPGNHDVDFTQEDDIKKRFQPFIQFVNFFRKNVDKNSSIDWRGEKFSKLGKDRLGTDGVYSFKEFPLDVYLINTVKQYTKKSKIIEIDKQVLDDISRKSSEIKGNKRFSISLIHNSPIIIFPEDESGKIVKNASDVLRIFAEAGVGLVLHGDQHESQHGAVTRAIGVNSWPIYTLGAGHLAKGAKGIAHYHLINLRFSAEQERDNCVEVEILSFVADGYGHFQPFDNWSYVFYLPIFSENNGYSRGTLHVFEIPQDRNQCANPIAKQFLHRYRIEALDRIFTSTKELLERQETTITPDHMFSFFYDSIFDIIQDKDIFYAMHHYDYLSWIRDTACIQSLPSQNEAYRKGASLERIIILTREEIEYAIENNNGRDVLKAFCAKMCEYQFPTFMTREDWISANYFSVIDEETRKIRRTKDLLPLDLSIGNIALFSCCPSLKKVTGENALAFYFTRVEIKPNSYYYQAHITRNDFKVGFIKECFMRLKQLKRDRKQRNNLRLSFLASCSELKDSDAKLDIFLS